MSGRILKEGVLGVLAIQLKSLFTNYRKRMKTSPAQVFSNRFSAKQTAKNLISS
jgi:hypothetical protein